MIAESAGVPKTGADTALCRSVRKFPDLRRKKTAKYASDHGPLLVAALYVNVWIGGWMSEQRAEVHEAISNADFSAVRALAAHLELTPQQLAEWLRESRRIPPQVLLSWICLWDLKRR